MPPESGSSMLWDRPAGRELEYDARNGAVVRAGARLGIPTPCNDTVTALLEAVSAPGNASWRRYRGIPKGRKFLPTTRGATVVI
jgi:ketopantoate reductase